jgi:molybdate transport repressor ModE-like protein
LTLRRKHRVELDGRFVIGEGGAELLQAVDRRGSLTEGGRQIGWSYRHAWGYIRRAEAVLGVSLVATKAGKGAAQGTVITDVARDIVFTLLPERSQSGSKMKRDVAAESTRGHNDGRTTDRLHVDA